MSIIILIWNYKSASSVDMFSSKLLRQQFMFYKLFSKMPTFASINWFFIKLQIRYLNFKPWLLFGRPKIIQNFHFSLFKILFVQKAKKIFLSQSSCSLLSWSWGWYVDCKTRVRIRVAKRSSTHNYLRCRSSTCPNIK